MQQSNKTILILLFCGIQLVNCSFENPRRTAEILFLQQSDSLPLYDLRKPVAKYFLPYVLEEISGLSYVSPGILACVQDEEGKVFFYDTRSKEITWQERFGKSGDYEGIEVVDQDVYVANSKGTLYSFQHGNAFDFDKVSKFKTALRKSNDVEGLGYDSEKNQLIIACKGDGEIKPNKVKGRGFYSFALDSMKLNKEPIFNIRKKDIKAFLEEFKDFEYEENRINFRPSGLALHPHTKLIYIIASNGKLLLIVNKHGKIRGSIPIDPRLLGQPEGICFAPNGDMFISSEGQGGKGYILKFKMKNTLEE